VPDADEARKGATPRSGRAHPSRRRWAARTAGV